MQTIEIKKTVWGLEKIVTTCRLLAIIVKTSWGWARPHSGSSLIRTFSCELAQLNWSHDLFPYKVSLCKISGQYIEKWLINRLFNVWRFCRAACHTAVLQGHFFLAYTWSFSPKNFSSIGWKMAEIKPSVYRFCSAACNIAVLQGHCFDHRLILSACGGVEV